jgi:hypothetical protein
MFGLHANCIQSGFNNKICSTIYSQCMFILILNDLNAIKIIYICIYIYMKSLHIDNKLYIAMSLTTLES